jgi:hypothetical protein
LGLGAHREAVLAKFGSVYCVGLVEARIALRRISIHAEVWIVMKKSAECYVAVSGVRSRVENMLMPKSIDVMIRDWPDAGVSKNDMEKSPVPLLRFERELLAPALTFRLRLHEFASNLGKVERSDS